MERKIGNGDAGLAQVTQHPTTHKSRQGHTLTRSLAVVTGDDEGLAGSSESGPTPTPPLGSSSPSLDLLLFIQQTINKNTKDRHLLLRTEAELIQFISSGSHSLPLPGPYSSYQRLLIHRVAAYFKLEHNLDATGSGILISRGTDSPLHDSERRKFRDLITPTTGTTEDFNDAHRRARKFTNPRPPAVQQGWTTGQRIMKVASFEGSERRAPAPPLHLAKAYSFGGYGRSQGQSHSGRGGVLSAQTSLSPASSGYKSTSFPSMELRTPSPAGPYFGDEAGTSQPATALALHDPPPLHQQLNPQQSQNASQGQELVLWAVSDLKSVPPGALLIDPNTLTPVRYQGEVGHHHGGASGALAQQGQILQQQYYPVMQQQQQALPSPLQHPTYLPVHNYCEHGAELGNWFAGMSLSPGQYYAAQPQSCGPSVQAQPTVYYPPAYNYYAPRGGTAPSPQRFYYGQGMAAPAPNYVQPGLIFQSQQHPHQHQHTPEHHHMAGSPHGHGQASWYNVTGPGQVTGAYGPRNGHGQVPGGPGPSPNTHTHPHPLSSHHKNKFRK